MHVATGRSLFFTASVALAALIGAPGCVDQEKCDEAIRVTRDAVAKEQTDLARQWRQRAYTVCKDTSTLSSLDKEIVDKETEIQKRETDRLKQIEEAAQRRMKLATTVWRKFNDLDDEDKTEERLETYRDKAAQMTKGLPDELAKQITEYNEKQLSKLEKQVEKLEKKRK